MLNTKGIICTISFVTVFILSVGAQSNSSRYCYNFSWLGPKYTNESTFDNATCDDVTMMAENVPCKLPLVITYDGSVPDIEYLRENHFADATCLLTEGEVCAIFTYKFNGHVLNKTHMCTTITDQNDNSVTSGSVIAKSGSRQIELFICRSNPGLYPCNSAPYNTVSVALLLTIAFLLVIKLEMFK